MITTQQIQQYREVGAVVVPGLLDEATRLHMKSVLADWVEGSRQVTAHNDLYDLEPGHTADDPRVRRIKKPHLAHPVFYEFARSKALADCLRQLPQDSVEAESASDQRLMDQWGSSKTGR